MTHITTSYQVCNILTDQSFPIRIETTLTSKKPFTQERDIQSTVPSFPTYIFLSTVLHIASVSGNKSLTFCKTETTHKTSILQERQRRNFFKKYLPLLQIRYFNWQNVVIFILISHMVDCLTLDDGTHRLSRNVGKKLPVYDAWNTNRAQNSLTQRRKP